jgi:single-strand DNA-binding protein
MNNVSFTGNAGRDAEVRYFESGAAVANFTVAIYTGKDKPPVWVPVSAWSKSAEIAADRVRKGVRVGIEGRLHMEEWTDKSTGENRSKLSVVANRIEVFDRSESTGGSSATQRPAQPAQSGWNSAPSNDFNDEEAPF